MATTTSLGLVKKEQMAKGNQARGRSKESSGMVPVANRPTLINSWYIRVASRSLGHFLGKLTPTSR